MATPATREELGDLAVVYNSLFDFVKSGKRPAGPVITGLQLLRDGEFPFEQQVVSTTSGLFSTPQEILARFAFYAGNQGLPPVVLAQLEESLPADHVSSLNGMLAPDIWLGDLPTTFEFLVGWLQYEQRQAGNGYWRWDGLKSDTKHLRLLDPDRYGKEPSGRWVELDMLAKRGNSPKEARDPAKSAGLQVVSAFAANPAYPPAIDYDTIPGAWAAGLQAKPPENRDWQGVPILGWRGFYRQVGVSADWDYGRHSHYAVPEVREL